jgi:GAF domain-containing protein
MPTQLAERLSSCTGLGSVLDCVLDISLELTGASLGNIQLMDWRAGYLTIEAQHGFHREFLEFFQRVKADNISACGRALRQQRAVIIEDVMSDADFAPCRAIAEHAGFRSVQSTPLVSTSGAFLGILSTHFPVPRRPTECEMDAVRSLGTLAANAIIRARARLAMNDPDAVEHCINRASEAIRHSRALLDRVEARSGLGRSSDALVTWRKSSVST